jgi:hypothetical protein
MNWLAGLAWLSALNPRHDADPSDDDRGDMGTAFGLDASLSSLADELGPAPAQPGPGHWEYRLTRRLGL